MVLIPASGHSVVQSITFPLTVSLPGWLKPRLPSLPPLLGSLPGSRQRRRALLLAVVAVLVALLRPWPPFRLMPGWSVGLLQLWALLEIARWLWWPRRWG